MIWYIAVGSAVGGVCRYLFGLFVQNRVATAFPLGTLLINIIGSLILGFLIRWTLETTTVSPEVRGMLTIGFCGGFTTFSAFSLETARLMEDGDYRRAAWYVGASVTLSILATFAGFALARAVLTAQRTF
jgi:CrcB protein